MSFDTRIIANLSLVRINNLDISTKTDDIRSFFQSSFEVLWVCICGEEISHAYIIMHRTDIEKAMKFEGGMIRNRKVDITLSTWNELCLVYGQIIIQQIVTALLSKKASVPTKRKLPDPQEQDKQSEDPVSPPKNPNEKQRVYRLIVRNVSESCDTRDVQRKIKRDTDVVLPDDRLKISGNDVIMYFSQKSDMEKVFALKSKLFAKPITKSESVDARTRRSSTWVMLRGVPCHMCIDSIIEYFFRNLSVSKIVFEVYINGCPTGNVRVSFKYPEDCSRALDMDMHYMNTVRVRVEPVYSIMFLTKKPVYVASLGFRLQASSKYSYLMKYFENMEIPVLEIRYIKEGPNNSVILLEFRTRDDLLKALSMEEKNILVTPFRIREVVYHSITD